MSPAWSYISDVAEHREFVTVPRHDAKPTARQRHRADFGWVTRLAQRRGRLIMWWRTLLAIAVGLLAVWLVMLALLWRAQRHTPDKTRLRDAVRLVPDVVRLLRRLAGDRTLPRSVRVRLWLLLIYLVSPIDVVPDFISVLGYADDAIIVAIALRSIIRRAGPEAVERHWPGTPEGLATLLTLAGLRPAAAPTGT